MIGEGIYEKGFEKGRLSAGLKHTQAFSDNTYAGNLEYKTNMKQADTYLYSEFQGKWNRLNYTVGIGVSRSWLKQEGEEGYHSWGFLMITCSEWLTAFPEGIENEYVVCPVIFPAGSLNVM